jgi:hypothetical protein
MVVVALFIKRGEAKRSEEKPISGFNLNRVFAENYSMVIQEVKSKVASFQDVVFKHKSRLSNSEPHKVSRRAVSSSLGRQLWLLQPPDGLCIPMTILHK